MSDERLRQAERDWRAEPTTENQAHYLGHHARVVGSFYPPARQHGDAFWARVYFQHLLSVLRLEWPRTSRGRFAPLGVFAHPRDAENIVHAMDPGIMRDCVVVPNCFQRRPTSDA